MSDSDSIIEAVGEAFLASLRAGEAPSISEFAAPYPEHRKEIEELLESIELLECVGNRETNFRKRLNADGVPADIEQLGDFDVVGVLGRGGMGVVYEANDRTLQRRVALKVLNDSALVTQRQLDRFQQESRLAAQLHHTNIVSVFGVGEDKGKHFYAMQYIEGVSLREVLGGLGQLSGKWDRSNIAGPSLRIAKAICTDSFAGSKPSNIDDQARAVRANSGSLNAAERTDARLFCASYWRSVARIGIQVADALAYAHGHGILHRDVKPANLLFDQDGTVWVTDFGLAKVAESDDFTKPGDVVGTLQYMAPEQLSGKADQRTDVYALGLTLYEMLTLEPLCTSTNYAELCAQKQNDKSVLPRVTNPAIPVDLATIIQKALEWDPERRYASAQDLSEDLRRFLDDRPILARRVSMLERTSRWCRRNVAVAVSIAAVMSSLLLVTAISFWSYAREAEQKGQAERMLTAVLDELDGLYEPYLFEEVADPLLYGDGDSYAGMAVSKDATRLLERTISVYDRLANEVASTDNTLLAVEAAEARRHVGDLYRMLGQFDDAMEAYRDAQASYEKLSRDQPQLTLERARIKTAQGAIHDLAQRHTEGRTEYEYALELLQDVPTSDQRDLEMARAHYLLGKQRIREGVEQPRGGRRRRTGGRRRRAGAEEVAKVNAVRENDQEQWEHLRAAIAILERLRESGGNAASYRFLRALCLRELADVDGQRGTNNDLAIELLQELAEEFPQVPRYRFELCQAYRRIHHLGLDDRIAQLLEARDFAEELVAEQESIAAYHITLAHIYAHLGVEFHNRREDEQAEASTLESIKAHEAIVRDFPGLASLSLELSTVDAIRLGEWYLRDDRHEELINLLQPIAERLFAELEKQEAAAATNESGQAFEEQTINGTRSLLQQCGNLLLPSYRATQDDIGVVVATLWLNASAP